MVATPWQPPDRQGACVAAPFSYATYTRIGDTLVPYSDDWAELHAALMEAAEEMVASGKLGHMSFDGRAITNVEMHYASLVLEHGLIALVNRWLDQFYDWIEGNHGSISREKVEYATCVARVGGDPTQEQGQDF